jgi:hypothetical protein
VSVAGSRRVSSVALALSAIVLGSCCAAASAGGGEYVYWANSNYNTIERSNLDGTRVNPTFITAVKYSFGVAVSNQYVYWTDYSGIGRANLDGSHVNDKFIPVPSKYARTWQVPNGEGELAVTSRYLYWALPGSNTIARADINGTQLDTNYLPAAAGVNDPTGLAVDARCVYWTDYVGGTIGRATVNGKTVWQDFITGAIGPVALAVNSSDGRPRVCATEPQPPAQA